MKDSPYVSETPGVCGGYPVVRGTRIPVRILVGMYQEYGDLAEILAAYPHLTAEQVRGRRIAKVLITRREPEVEATEEQEVGAG